MCQLDAGAGGNSSLLIIIMVIQLIEITKINKNSFLKPLQTGKYSNIDKCKEHFM